MKRIYSTCVGLGVLLCTLSCKLNEAEDPIIIAEVEKEFFVEMREQPGPAPRSLDVMLRTIKVQDCLNAGIRYDFWATNARFRLDIAGIQAPVNCITGAAQAHETLSLGALQEGLYSFDINLKNTVTNQGALSITNDSYALNMITEEGLVITNKLLRRIPDFSIWGYAAYSAPATSPIANAFVNELAALSNVSSFPAGHYGHFSIASGSGQISISESPTDLNLRPFVFRFTGNMDDLRSFVQSYRSAHGQLLQIKLMAITGESL